MDWSRVSTCELLFLSVFISCFELFLLQYQDDVTNRACISQTLLIYCVSLSLCVLHSGGQSELSGSCTIGDALLLLSPSLSDFWCHSDFSSQTVIFPASVIHLMSFRTECVEAPPPSLSLFDFSTQNVKIQLVFFLSILTAVNSLRIKHRGNLAFKKLHLKM